MGAVSRQGPKQDAGVVGGRDGRHAIVCDRNIHDCVAVPAPPCHLRAAAAIPDADGLIDAAREEHVVAWMPHEFRHRLLAVRPRAARLHLSVCAPVCL